MTFLGLFEPTKKVPLYLMDPHSNDGLIHCAFSIPNHYDCLHHLIKEAEVQASERRWRFLRTRFPVNDLPINERSNGWYLSHYVVRKILECSPSALGAPASLRTATPLDIEFILDLLTRGLFDGLTLPELDCYDIAVVRSAAKSNFLQILGEAPHVLIAKFQGVRVGHGVANMAWYSETLGTTEAFIHDVLVIPEFAARGISRQITVALERAAYVDVGIREFRNGRCSEFKYSSCYYDRNQQTKMVAVFGLLHKAHFVIKRTHLVERETFSSLILLCHNSGRLS